MTSYYNIPKRRGPTLSEAIATIPKEIFQHFKEVSFKKGDIIAKKGEEVKYGYIFMEGSADIKEETLGGKDFIISREDYSSTCSFMDIYSGHEFYCCTVQAKTDCVGYRLTIDDCWRLLHSDSLFHEYLIVRWANIFYKSTNNSYRYTIYTFREKLFTFLLENGEKTHQNSYIIHISREELANLIGCSKRTLYRILNEMKVKNLISIVETRIVYTAEQKIKLEKEREKLQE